MIQSGKERPDVYALVAQETVDLLDRMLARLAARLRQRLTNDRDRQRRAGHHAEHTAGQRADTFGVQVRAEQRIEIVLNEFKPLCRRPHYPAIREIDSLTNHVAKRRGKIKSRKNEGIPEGLARQQIRHSIDIFG